MHGNTETPSPHFGTTLLSMRPKANQVVTWVTDPMHGNTETVEGYKTRRYDKIRAEVSLQLM